MRMLRPSGTFRSAQPFLAVVTFSIALFLAACSSDSAASEPQPQEQQQATSQAATPVPTLTPIATVPKEVGSCEVGPKAQCPGADFSGQDMSEISVGHVGASKGREGADFTEANLEGAKFVGANLKGVVFDGANLRNASFQNANAREVSFYRADLTGVDFTGADIELADFEDAILDGVIYCNTKMKDGTMSKSGCP